MCASKCLGYSNCMSFNYPKDGYSFCVLKYNLTKSTVKNWDCGGPNKDWQYYTLLERYPDCSGNSFYHFTPKCYDKFNIFFYCNFLIPSISYSIISSRL